VIHWREVWTRLQSLGFFVFLGVIGCSVGLLFLPLLHQSHSMEQEIQRLDGEIARQETLEKQQRAEIEALKTDAAYVERTARNKLNLARPNEIIFRFEPVPSAAPSSR
jgi:cell division protein FtsB